MNDVFSSGREFFFIDSSTGKAEYPRFNVQGSVYTDRLRECEWECDIDNCQMINLFFAISLTVMSANIKEKFHVHLTNRSVWTDPETCISTIHCRLSLKTCSHGAIVTAIYLLQLMGGVRLSVIVQIAPCVHLHWIAYNESVVSKYRSRNRIIWTAL